MEFAYDVFMWDLISKLGLENSMTGECGHCGTRQKVFGGKVANHKTEIIVKGKVEYRTCSGSGRPPMPPRS
jgi:hypothetical protein